MANRRTVHIYFGSHKDCFVHGTTREWNSWLKTSQDNLNIVSLSLVDGFKVFATFSTRPALPSNRSKKAKHLQPPEYYLEIDPDYAQCLGIKEGDKATIECIPDVTTCISMTVESTDQDDYEVLEQNKEMIVFQMLDQVRIISCKRPFAIWINQQPIFFSLVKSEPPAAWVLIGNKTFVDIKTPEPNTMLSPSVLTSPLPTRTDSQDSDESGQTGSTASSYFSSLSHQSKQPRVHTVEPNKGTGGKMKEPVKKRFSHSDTTSFGETLCFPKEDEFHDNPEGFVSNEEGSYVDRLLNFWNLNTLFRGHSPNEEQQGPLGSQSQPKQNPSKIPFLAQRGEYKSPQKKKISVSQSFTYGAKGKHIKQPSWHGHTEYELEKRQSIRSIAMPIMLNPIQVRVQDINLDKLKAVWDIHEYNEVFVHPSTLPYLFQTSKGGMESYLVTLSFASGTKNSKDTKLTGSAPQSTTPTPSPFPKQALSSHLPEKPKKDDQGVMNMMTQLSHYEDSLPSIIFTPPTSQPPAAHQPPHTQPQSPTMNSVVCRLQFATVIQFNNRRKKSASQTLEEVSISREGSTSPTTGAHPSPSRQPRVMGCVPVLPNHIVMSDLMRQQLGVKAGSVVRLAGCHESWRVNCRYSRVSLYLHPVTTKKSNEQSALGSSNEGRKKSDIIRAFKSWIGKFEERSYGCVFANNMVIPLNINLSSGGTALVSCSSEEVLLCKVTCKVDKLQSSGSIAGTIDTPQIFTITVNDLRKDAIKESMHYGIEILPVIDRPEDSGTGLGANNIPKQTSDLPSLEELAPPRLVESLNQFGGMEELFSVGYRSLTNLLEHTPGGVLLICGVGGGGGVGGCGKTSLARLLCKELMETHHKTHVKIESCTLFRGKRYESIQKKFKDILHEVIHCQPCVILLDDLDNCAQNITDVQKEATGEGIMHLRNAQIFLDFINILRQRAIKAVVIATATNKDLLHSSLLHSKGKHVFSDTIEIPPPNMNIRLKILEAILRSMNTASILSESDLRTICLKTEGYQAIDIKVLVSRAIRNAEQRHFFAQIENQIPPNSLGRVGRGGVAASSPQVSVGLSDFLIPLNSYVPASLSGLSLHKSGHTNFKSIGGLEEAKATLQETLLWPSKYPRLFKACPIKQHAGILLYGGPGTGKTLLAGAVANEFGLNFVSIKGPELLNKFIGASEQSVRDLFTRAQAARPCILFFDEFDSLAPRRGHDRTGVTDRVVNQILTQLDGVEALEGVYVLAASSRPDLIDPALLRPGRIDKILLCNIPTETDRELILKALSKDLPLSLDVDFKVIASKTQDYTGADLKALLYNAQLLQVRRTLESKNNEQTSPTFQDNRTSNVDESDTTTVATGNTSSMTSDKLVTHSIKLTQSDSNPSNNNTKDHSTTGKVWQFNYKKQTVGMETTTPVFKQVKEQSQRHSTNAKPNQRARVKCLVSQEDLLTALSSTKPSLSETERKKYEKIYEKFLGKSKTNITDFDQRATLA